MAQDTEGVGLDCLPVVVIGTPGNIAKDAFNVKLNDFLNFLI